MVHFMPKIYLMNIEEAQNGNALYNISNNLQKYIWLMSDSDIFVAPLFFDTDFLEYIAKIKCLDAKLQIITPEELVEPYSLIGSIYNNKKTMAELKHLSNKNHWEIEPYIQTEKVVEFANDVNIPSKATDSNLIRHGLTEQCNSKLYFKTVCEKLGLKTPSWNVVDCIEDARQYLKNSNSFKKMILKKAKSLGGAGNLSGYPNELLSQLEKWYTISEPLLIEEYCDFSYILGSLSSVKQQEIKFFGIDEQIVSKDSWKGLKFPAEINVDLQSEIRVASEKVADLFRELGGIGYLNLDFGVVSDKHHNAVLYALESNFRQNAFNVFFENFAKPNRKLYYYGNFKTNMGSFNELKDLLDSERVDDRPLLAKNFLEDYGAIIINYAFNQNIFGALIFGEDDSYIQNAYQVLQRTYKE